MRHVLSSERGMQVQRWLKIVDDDNGTQVLIQWKGLPGSENTEEPLQCVHENVPILLAKLLDRTSTPRPLLKNARRALALHEKEV